MGGKDNFSSELAKIQHVRI